MGLLITAYLKDKNKNNDNIKSTPANKVTILINTNLRIKKFSV